MNRKIINIGLFIISAFIIASFIPTNGMFRYDFALGEEWSDKTLVAPYDFPIYKTATEYQSDIDDFNNRYIPVYRRDSSIKKEALGGLKQYYTIDDSELLKENYSKLSFDRKRCVLVYNTMSFIYQRGIIDTSNDTVSVNSSIIRVVNGGNIESKNINNIFNIKSAVELIKRELKSNSMLQNEALFLSEAKQFLAADVVFDSELNSEIYKQERSRVSSTKGLIRKGKTIIEKGDVISGQKYSVLNSYKAEHIGNGGAEFSLLPYFGNFLYVLIVLTLSYFSIYFFYREFLNSVRNVIFLMLLYIVLVGFSMLVTKINFYPLSIYLVPFAIFPLYINNFFGSRMSIYQYIFVLLIAAMVTPAPFEFILTNYLAGLAGMYILQRTYQRNVFFISVVTILLIYIVLYTTMTIVQDGSLVDFNWRRLVWFGVNSLLLVALYQLIYVIEKVFKFVSNITLVELCDTNQKILLDLAMQAPGTFQHSMQVANLSESAAKAINANHLLARTGAIYHDIGKSLNPMLFVENNNGSSLHSKLNELQSAEVIRNHVVDGVKLARRSGLPKEVVDFILTHHGTSLIYFFYRKYVDSHPGEVVDEKAFRYPGPCPMTRETTICMIADAVEAASRTLKEYTPHSISVLVDNIVRHQMEGGQYVNSPLTFQEMEIVKEALKDKIANIYHSRIEYPK